MVSTPSSAKNTLQPLGEKVVDGIFMERPNRYLARVEVAGQETWAHVPDPGRLPGLMIPGRRVRLVYNPGPKRKTDYSLVLVRHGSLWVSVYPVFANTLVANALAERQLPFFEGYREFSSEVKMGGSRIDFRVDFSEGSVFVEVKSVSLVEEGIGKFPDAPTTRGVKHLKELMALRKSGQRAAVLFVSQRSDTQSIVSNDAVDPAFGECLRAAKNAGVELYGMNCKVTPSAIALDRALKVVVSE